MAMPTDSVPRQIRELSTPGCAPSTAVASHAASGTGEASASRPLLVSNGRFVAGLLLPNPSLSRLPRAHQKVSLHLPWLAPLAAARKITWKPLVSRPRATSVTRAETLRCRAFPVSKPRRLCPCQRLLLRAHRGGVHSRTFDTHCSSMPMNMQHTL